MSKTYNGHKNWDYWNVSLWIGNDEGLYLTAKGHINRCKNRDDAARAFLSDLEELGITQTPDGATYNFSRVRAALSGL
jgi:hypothetical protein